MGERPQPLLDRVASWIIVPAVLVIIAVGFAAIVLRYAFSGEYSIFWAEEFIRYGFIWVFWLVSPIAVRNGTFAVDMLVERLPRGVHLLLAVACNLAILAVLAIYTWEGVNMTRVNNAQLSTALEIPMAWVYSAIPIGSAGMFVVVALQTWTMVRTRSLPPRPKMQG